MIGNHCEFQIFISNRIPILVSHHHRQQEHTGSQKEAVQVMRSKATEFNRSNRRGYRHGTENESKEQVTK